MKNIDFKKIASYSKAGPRYTSYPTAVEFNTTFSPKQYSSKLQYNDTLEHPLSIYVHLPFCKDACYFCACNVIYTHNDAKKDRYITYLKKELDLLKNALNVNKSVVQLHFGGGTPTYFSANQLKQVIDLIRGTFTNFADGAEISCEIDPRFFNKDQMKVLKDGGFNRLSFGLQDFDDGVQKAVNRIQSFELVQDCVKLARDFGINSINFDLIYGLPLQNTASFEQTLKKTLALNPDRLAVFNYAHVPWVKATMARIKEADLPDPIIKLEMFKFILDFLEQNGFYAIGMDHFAKKTDSLYDAAQNGTLRRNFQGYTTKGFSQTIGIGVTSIGEGYDYYAQNFKDLEKYEQAIDSGMLPLERGIALDFEDILRKEIIMQLMNNFKLNFSDIENKFDINFCDHFEPELSALGAFVDDDILEISDSSIIVNETGKFVIRNVAMVFDTRSAQNNRTKFSKTI
ncbi:MAG: oxygen-independent coproporphyrinogen III oxidase [Helicobacter sp.]|nr:oxygen-independent coproporphyrinogen III oxidase [Helicobacter sp.]